MEKDFWPRITRDEIITDYNTKAVNVDAYHRRDNNNDTAGNGEGKRQNEFVEWHVAWLAEWHNYAECKIWKMTQRNKLN